MTEATEAKKDDVDPFEIPWFLDAKNPENIARRAELAKILTAKMATKAAPKRASRPAKSVATMPKAEQVITKPHMTIAVPAPACKPKNSKLNGDMIIRVLVKEFGHKAGSKAEIKSAALKDGMTVAEYMANDLGISGKWHSSHLSHCVSKNFIKLEG